MRRRIKTEARGTWTRRRKRALRRLANDLRSVAPMIVLVLLFASSATAIFAAEYVPGDAEGPLPIAATSLQAACEELAASFPWIDIER